MNVRKNIDYSEMYEELDKLMAQQLPQTKLCCEIGKAVCRRAEKGAAVMASEYLNKRYPDTKGFSPRSLRRMRDFYRTYEKHPVLLSLAMGLGWTQNVVIMEADLTMELRKWYLRAARQFGWSKTELIVRISEQAHMEIILSIEGETSDTIGNKDETDMSVIAYAACASVRFVPCEVLPRCRGRPKRGKTTGIHTIRATYNEAMRFYGTLD